MPQRPAQKKSLRQNRKKALRNKAVKSRLRTEQNKLERMLERGDLEAGRRQFALLTKLFHRAAASNVIHANRAARQQARLEQRLNEVAQAQS